MAIAPEVRGSSSNSSNTHEATNTLIITKVPPALLSPLVTPSLREFFERFGQIEAWVPLTGFERVVVVYTHEADAEHAKSGMDHTLVEGFGKNREQNGRPDEQVKTSCVLRVYRGLPTPLESVRNRQSANIHLPVPDTDKNFLISPPGSPPVGWESIREDPPNATTLADDLARALENLSSFRDHVQDVAEEGPESIDENENSTTASSNSPSLRPSSRDTLIIPHRRTESGSLPSVLVSDTDIDEEPRPTNGLSIEQAFSIQRRTPTSRPPPGPISHVKATVESMQDSYELPSPGPRIDRTPRPPLQTD